MHSRVCAVLFACSLLSCDGSAPAKPHATSAVDAESPAGRAPVVISSDYGLGIIGGATNGPDRHAADVDDAYAVTLALRHTAVKALVSTFGNTKARPSADAARRGIAALGIADSAERVRVGSEGFLDAERVSFAPAGRPAPFYCLNDGVERLREVLDHNAPATVTLFAIGPFTDIACLRRAHPDAFAKLAEIVALAGSFDGRPILENKPVVDFNFAMDPSALGEVVAQDDVPLTLLMFEVSRLGVLSRTTLDRWVANGTPAQQYYARATLPHTRYWDAIFTQTDGQALFDAHSVHYFVDRSAYVCEDEMVAVATVAGYPDTNAATTKNFFTVTPLSERTEPAESGVQQDGSAMTYTGRVRGCYAFASTTGVREFVKAVEDSVEARNSAE